MSRILKQIPMIKPETKPVFESKVRGTVPRNTQEFIYYDISR